MAEIITRKWKGGELVSESRKEVDWKPNAADLDVVMVGCPCGNKFDMPRDALWCLSHESMSCGQCGKSGIMEVISDTPGPKEHTEHCQKRMAWGDGECECGRLLPPTTQSDDR